MYRKESEGWFKHTDFILLDMIVSDEYDYVHDLQGTSN